MNLRRKVLIAGIAILIIVTTVTVSLALAGNGSGGKPVKVRGLLRDVACPLQNQEGTSRKFNKKCAMDCVKAGAPIGILTDDGSLYLVISDTMPDVPQNEKVMPYVGKYVEVSGNVFERKGVRAIMIREIKEDKNVRLTELSE
jgi:hypothetical protein